MLHATGVARRKLTWIATVVFLLAIVTVLEAIPNVMARLTAVMTYRGGLANNLEMGRPLTVGDHQLGGLPFEREVNVDLEDSLYGDRFRPRLTDLHGFLTNNFVFHF